MRSARAFDNTLLTFGPESGYIVGEMELSRQAVEKVATVFLNLGQGIILADLLAALLTFIVGGYTAGAATRQRDR
ncbi:MAG: hypothetical protein HW407_2260 [Bacteroidetes bacterium]|nr:hypothetical protein [Bacteroidota bacterium]